MSDNCHPAAAACSIPGFSLIRSATIGMLIGIPALSGLAVAQELRGLPTEHQLQLLVDEYVAEDEPGLVALIALEDRTVAAAAGLSQLDPDASLDTDDTFRIASVSKMMTATVVLQLVEEGRVELDRPLSDYLPERAIEFVENACTSTIRQLLSMRSGIYNYTENEDFDDAVGRSPGRWWTAQQVLDFAREPAYFGPGEGFYYSNTNYILLQLLIEELSGQRYHTALHDRLFAPLGMHDSFVETRERFGSMSARGYEYSQREGRFRDLTTVNDGVGLGDGGVVSSAKDLNRFHRALFNGDLISATIREGEMLDFQPDGEGGEYGLGISRHRNPTGLGHEGSSSGYQADLTLLPESGHIVVMLTNDFDSLAMTDLRDALFELVAE